MLFFKLNINYSIGVNFSDSRLKTSDDSGDEDQMKDNQKAVKALVLFFNFK